MWLWLPAGLLAERGGGRPKGDPSLQDARDGLQCPCGSGPGREGLTGERRPVAWRATRVPACLLQPLPTLHSSLPLPGLRPDRESISSSVRALWPGEGATGCKSCAVLLLGTREALGLEEHAGLVMTSFVKSGGWSSGLHGPCLLHPNSCTQAPAGPTKPFSCAHQWKIP